jgi:predicted peptidase
MQFARFLLACMLAGGWIAPMTKPTQAADAKDLFEARTFRGTAGELKYRLLKPKDYNANRKYPVVIFFHGAGERGDDNAKQLVHGMGNFASDEIRQKYPAFVVAPQCPAGQQWVNVPWSAPRHDMPKEPAPSLALSMELLDALEKEFSIDTARQYVTGLSMGGYATWDAIQRYPDRFAAAAPICGGGDDQAVKEIAKLPIWAFHGDQDTAVKPERSRAMISALKTAGGEPKYTEYKNTGHDSWSATYRDPEFYAWLFAQKKASE